MLRRIGLVIGALTICLVMLEIGTRSVRYQALSSYSLALHEYWNRVVAALFDPSSVAWSLRPRDGSSLSEGTYVSDPIVGYRYRPGSYEATVTYRVGPLRFSRDIRVRVDAAGNRVTSDDVSRFAGRPEIHVYGGSFAFGHGESDEDTFPWILQELMWDYQVHNFGQGGFGTVQGYLQLRDSIGRGAAPSVAIFAYNPWHIFRNVLAPSWTDHIQMLKSGLRLARAFVGPDGRLKTELVEPRLEAGPDPPIAEILKINTALLSAIRDLARRSDVYVVLASQTGIPCPLLGQGKRYYSAFVTELAMCDPIVLAADQVGIDVVDVATPLDPYYTLQPYDSHHNRRAYAKHALGIARHLRDRGY